MIFYKRINGKETNRLDIFYYLIKQQYYRGEIGNKKNWIKWTKEYQDYKKMGGNV